MNYWLVKSDPNDYSWNELKKDKETFWDGVRNYQARNFLKDMKKGDLVYVYESVTNRDVKGIAEITKESYQDPTTDDDRWVAVDIKFKEELKNPVNLKEIKQVDSLQEIALIKQSRLSVMPLTKKEFDTIYKMSEEK